MDRQSGFLSHSFTTKNPIKYFSIHCAVSTTSTSPYINYFTTIFLDSDGRGSHNDDEDDEDIPLQSLEMHFYAEDQ